MKICLNDWNWQSLCQLCVTEACARHSRENKCKAVWRRVVSEPLCHWRGEVQSSSLENSQQIRAGWHEGVHLETTLHAERLTLRWLKSTSHFRYQSDLPPVDTFLAQYSWHGQPHWTALKGSLPVWSNRTDGFTVFIVAFSNVSDKTKKSFDQIVLFALFTLNMFFLSASLTPLTDWECDPGRVRGQKKKKFVLPTADVVQLAESVFIWAYMLIIQTVSAWELPKCANKYFIVC